MKAASGGSRSALKVMDLSHVFANDNFDFKAVISKLSEISGDGPLLVVWISRYQVKTAKEIQDHVIDNKLPVTVIFDSRETITKPL